MELDGFGGGKGFAFRVLATSNSTSLGGGEQKFWSLYICTASLTSSISIIFFLAWFDTSLASSTTVVTYL